MPRRKGGGDRSRNMAISVTRARAAHLKSTTISEKVTTDSIRTKEVKLSAPPENPRKATTENKKSRGRPFPDRLEWKMSHLSMPTTSTPVRKPTTRAVVTKEDVDTAFGFDESTNSQIEINYSTVISPIAHASPKSLIPPNQWKANPLTQRNIECEYDPPSSSKRDEPVNRPKKEAGNSKLTHPQPSVPTLSSPKPDSSVKLASSTKQDNSVELASSPKEARVNEIDNAEAEKLQTEVLPERCTETTEAPVNLRRSCRQRRPRVTVTAKPKQLPKKPGRKKGSPGISEETTDGVSPFSQLLHRYNSDVDDDDDAKAEEVELHVNPKRIVRTYGSRKRVKYSEDRELEYDFIPISLDVPSSKTTKKGDDGKPKRRKKTTKKEDEEDLDDETRRWLEEKNKEFEDVQKMPLVIESSFSD